MRALRNAVRTGRVAHAYLFTGPRGTGKTSAARILARAVNCRHPRDANPCNSCEMCVAAREGRALDVIEIDAASNTSVDNVRDLRERVAYASSEGRYKVYIVDEVHRLSGAAFDAFLKTLEEPPPHVIFVFASTEPHKVPATIASRCQRFDFRRIPTSVTLQRLKEVAAGEDLQVGEGALALIAHGAGGSLRDALGLLDQAAAYGAEITEATVRDALGLADPEVVARLTDHLLAGDVGAGLTELQRFLELGGDARQLAAQLGAYFRALLHAIAGVKTDGLDPGLVPFVAPHAEKVTQPQVLAVLRAFSDADLSPKYNVLPSLPLEMAYAGAALVLRHERASTAVIDPVARVEPTTDVAVSPEPAPPAPAATASASPADLDRVWADVVIGMRAKSPSLQALLRSGYLLKVEQEEVTVGFLHDFHRNQFADVAKRRLLEEVLSRVLGSPHRVSCIRTTRDEVTALRGRVEEDDGFVEEAAERLRRFHAQQLSAGNS